MALEGLRHGVVLATKCGRYGLEEFDLSAGRVTERFEDSPSPLASGHLHPEPSGAITHRGSMVILLPSRVSLYLSKRSSLPCSPDLGCGRSSATDGDEMFRCLLNQPGSRSIRGS